MSDFDGTCAVSNLPIPEGGAVRIVFGFESGRLRHRDWIPATLPLCGLYDGCGGVDELDTRNSEFSRRLWLKFARSHVELAMHSWTPNNTIVYHDVPFGFVPEKYSTLSALMDFARQDCTYIRDRGRKSLQYALIREDIWRTLFELPLKDGRDTLEQELEGIQKAWRCTHNPPEAFFEQALFEWRWIKQSVSNTWFLARTLGEDPPHEFFVDSAKMSYALDTLMDLRITLNAYPLGFGLSDWEIHATALETWAKIARSRADIQKAERLQQEKEDEEWEKSQLKRLEESKHTFFAPSAKPIDP